MHVTGTTVYTLGFKLILWKGLDISVNRVLIQHSIQVWLNSALILPSVHLFHEQLRMLSFLESNTNSIECCATSLAVWPILCYIPTISLSKQKDKTCSLSSNICAQSQVTQTELKQ